MVIIEQGGTAERTFKAADGTIDNMTTTIVFSYYKLNTSREIAKEQEQTDYNFIYLCGGDLRPPNHEVVPARRVFRHAGMDVTRFTSSLDGKASTVCCCLNFSWGFLVGRSTSPLYRSN
jgi:hypothetical protein